MSNARLLPENRTAALADGESLLDWSLRQGIQHTHACGGQARCSTCRVLVVEGADDLPPRTEAETRIAAIFGFPPEIRLACQLVPTADLTARRLVLDGDDAALVHDALEERSTVGVEQRLAILFADIRGFTGFAERLPAYDVIHVLNRFFRHMDRAVEAHGGTINTTMGDGFMALFGLGGEPDMALRAVRAALDILAAMEYMTPHLQTISGAHLRLGVGIHLGEVVVGPVGAGRFRRLTAIGDAVNVASRVEAATKEASASILITEPALRAAGDRVIATEKCSEVTLRGKSDAFTLFEVSGLRIGSEVRSEEPA